VLSTSLAEDVVSLVDTQRHVLQGFLAAASLWSTKEGNDVFVAGLRHIVRCLNDAQRRQRALFLTALDDCCRASNDFMRLSELMELSLEQLHQDVPFLAVDENDDKNATAAVVLYREWNEYVSMLSRDAVFCAEHAQVFAMRHVNRRTSIASDFFSQRWEDDWTHNQVATRFVQVLDSFLVTIEQFLSNDYCYRKALVNVCKAAVCFYVRCLVEKADSVSRRRRRGRNHHRDHSSPLERKPFQHANRALIRMMDDIKILKQYFLEKADGDVTTMRIVANEMCVLELIHECLDSDHEDSLEAFIVVIHKRTGADSLVTTHFVRDLWLLVAHDKGRSRIDEAMMVMQQDLHMVSTRMKEQSLLDKKMKADVSFVRLDEMLKALYEDRLVQGTLPACWTCLPKTEIDGNEIVAEKIRKLTRNLKEMRWK